MIFIGKYADFDKSDFLKVIAAQIEMKIVFKAREQVFFAQARQNFHSLSET